jgi:hypothetical protein
MGILDKIKFQWDDIGHVEGLIKEWKPSSCESEKDYEKSLYTHLEKGGLEGKITKQYGVGRSKVDIAVGKDVFVELKKDLKNTGQLQRLIGQLEIYSKDLNNVIIVLCGEVDKNLLKQLIDKVKSYGSWDPLGFDCRILEK